MSVYVHGCVFVCVHVCVCIHVGVHASVQYLALQKISPTNCLCVFVFVPLLHV